MPDIYEEIMKVKAEGKRAAVATIIATQGSTPREVGAKMLIHEDGKIFGTIGGGCLEGEVFQEALKVIAEEKPRTVHMDLTGRSAEETGMICGGIMDLYVEPVVPRAKVYIFGAGHVSLFVSRISAMVGFEVAVIDDRPDFANRERFPDAAEVIAEDFEMVLPKMQVNRAAYIVIVTRGHAYDQEVLEWALRGAPHYIGMIGSRKKIQTVYKNLQERGFAPETFQRVHAPIGLNIGALTPEEIAVSIVAEMIQVRRKNQGEKAKSNVCHD
jgi:xanthine dehydrogenase accessory factor